MFYILRLHVKICQKHSVAERVKLLLWGHRGKVMQERLSWWQPMLMDGEILAKVLLQRAGQSAYPPGRWITVKLEMHLFIIWVGTTLRTASLLYFYCQNHLPLSNHCFLRVESFGVFSLAKRKRQKQSALTSSGMGASLRQFSGQRPSSSLVWIPTVSQTAGAPCILAHWVGGMMLRLCQDKDE